MYLILPDFFKICHNSHIKCPIALASGKELSHKDKDQDHVFCRVLTFIYEKKIFMVKFKQIEINFKSLS